MHEIVRELAYSDETKTLRLYMPMGAGGSWFVSIDKLHYGQVIWRGKWVAKVHEELTTVEIGFIEEMITQVMPRGEG